MSEERMIEARLLLPLEWEQEMGFAIIGDVSDFWDLDRTITIQEFFTKARRCQMTKLPQQICRSESNP